MNRLLRNSLLPFVLLASSASALHGASVSWAAEEAPSIADVEAARRCAAQTRVAGHAFAEVRDSVNAGGTTRAEALLTEAEDALKDARAACAGDADVSAQLELLANEAASLRRSLPSSR